MMKKFKQFIAFVLTLCMLFSLSLLPEAESECRVDRKSVV